LLVVAFVVLTLLGVGATSRYALLAVLVHGLSAVIVVLPLALGGLWLVPSWTTSVSRDPDTGTMPLSWHLLLGATLGLGAGSILILILGLAGCLHRTTWLGILVVSAAAGVVRLRTLLAPTCSRDRAEPSPDKHGSNAWPLLWLLLCPFLVLALLAASNAPGFIWGEEGFGYDVLEYHLQLPREYLQAGRIEYVPHNVYGNFPANVEMLYLLAMIVLDDVFDIGVVANMIHLILAVLTVFAAYLAGREWSEAAGVVSAVAIGTAGWLAYLCGLAYVENGMLLFAMAAAAVLIRHIRTRHDPTGKSGEHEKRGKTTDTSRSIALAGVLSGFACGCKYTALPLLAVPLALLVLLQAGRSTRRRIIEAMLFGGATLLTFAPWLIKNQLMTGNPVFPLANTVFQASLSGWGTDETQRWNRAHSLPEHDRALTARLGIAWNHTVADKHQRFGPAIILIGLVGLLGRRRRRVDLLLLVILLIQLGAWLFMTHLFARFAVVWLIPLALLCGRAVVDAGGPARRSLIVLGLVTGSAWNLGFAAQLHRDESRGGAPASLMYGGTARGFEYFRVVNEELPPDVKILLVGEARAFYFQREVDYCVTFNHNPFLAAVRSAATPEDVAHWVRTRQYSHLLVNWTEIGRLASTYGFSPSVDEQQLEEIFDALPAAGIEHLHRFPHPLTGVRHVDLYDVSP